MSDYKDKTIGILAIQGDFKRFQEQLSLLGVRSRFVKLPRDLEGLDGLILPGGESTTISIMIDRFGLRSPLRNFAKDHPILGTCAGLIMLAKRIEDNLSGVETLGVLDVDVVRNGYGRQVHSFEEDLKADFGDGSTRFTATFIRAPRITRIGDGVKTILEFDGIPVLVKEKNIMAGSFHAELGNDIVVLGFFLRTYLSEPIDYGIQQ